MTATIAAREDAIRARAHALWLEEGRPDGRAEIHWFRALDLLNSEGGEPAPVAAKPKRKVPRKRS